jgi:hypothetical protein
VVGGHFACRQNWVGFFFQIVGNQGFEKEEILACFFFGRGTKKLCPIIGPPSLTRPKKKKKLRGLFI